MALNIPGVIAVVVFYILILGTGVWAARKSRQAERNNHGDRTAVVLLGDRNISLLVGIFTMTATWVGGGFVLGIAEAVYTPKMGLIWALMPIQYSVSFIIGGLFFAKPMREKKYVTMIDPFQIKYGTVLSGALSLPCLLVDVLWVSCTLLGLGATMSVILDFPYAYSVWISSAVAIVYTLLGGLYSVAYTDIIQLSLVFLSLWLCVPFLLLNPTSKNIAQTAFNHTFQDPWVGTLEKDTIWKWIDDFLMLTGILPCMVLHLHLHVVSTVLSFLLPCNTSLHPISQSLELEPWLLLSCHPQTLACCLQLQFSRQTSTRTSCVKRKRTYTQNQHSMALNVPGLAVMAVFYLLILGTGIWASMRSKKEEKKCSGDGMEITLLAGRNINLLVGIFTLTATWVGGGFILGIAEATYNPTLGAVWALMPVPYVLTFFLGGFFFAKPMRENKYVTMMDPFQQKYGNVLSSALIFPALVADVLWVARTLVSLGGTMSVILDLPYVYSIIISSVVAIIYTLLGGLYSVAYTDVIQLILIFVSLWVCVPFLMTNPHSVDISLTAYNHTFQEPWVGTVELNEAGKWFDDFMLLALGGLAYQAFYQRILSASSYTQAQVTCFASSAFCLVLGIPSVLVGAVAASTDWNSTTYGLPTPYEREQAGSILPIALQYLTPPYISVIGIGAVAAAVMSSMDSALLSSASLFSSNIYKNIIRKQASDREMQWVIRISVVVVGLAGTALTFLDNSVLVFWLVGVDMSYTIMFPQLVCILFFKVSNGYGATVGYLMGLIMRILSGEPLIGLPPAIKFPGCRPDEKGRLTQFFPFRTAIMVISLASILLFSWLASIIFNKGLLSEKWDVFKIKRKQKPSVRAVDEKRTNPDSEEASVAKQLLDTTSC